MPQILPKNNSYIFILPSNSPYVSLIGNTSMIDSEKSYNLIPEELPIDIKLIIKREIIYKNNDYFLVLTAVKSSKEYLTEKVKLIKNNFSKVFGESQNKYYPIFLYNPKGGSSYPHHPYQGNPPL